MSTIIPSLFVKNEGDQSVKIALKLTTARNRVVVRLTGGCGYMSAEDARDFLSLFAEAFSGFAGAMLFGGTRMIEKQDASNIVPGITEIPSHIREVCPNMVSLGVVPRTSDIKITEHGLVVSESDVDTYRTIIHPNQDMCLLVQVSPDQPAIWDAEFEECLQIIKDLREFADFKSLLIVYNGGGVTEREILATAKRGWPVLLIRGSGRNADVYASNKAFLESHPNVRVAEKDSDDIRQHLISFGILPPEKLRLVKSQA
ncbi:MAG: hypothetical protein NTX72_01740 [Candidatus Uhrbacteria bacterium]|nr:hypothetical protein [Candidatus Uhrbacteria bacterium]